ncbi:hypothetical protein C8J56DRAFT_1165045 [Mycena floridula]|nr:hypothetical protein C8J56DRAFT_1165045 [Mycena floridula]
MPSFSLVRRSGKQRKVTIDSPVSSGLVEQHIGHKMAGSNSGSWTRQQSQAGNVFSVGRANDSHNLSSGPVALSQRVEGLALRNINAPVMSNNNVNISNHISNYYGSQANFHNGDAICCTQSRGYIIYLEEEIERYLDEENVWRIKYKGQIMTSSARNMSIWSYHGERAEEELEQAYQVYASLPRLVQFTHGHIVGLSHGRHPNILQLYGICCSPHLTALVFHGAPRLIYRWEYYKLLPSSQWIPHYLKLHQQNESAHSMLEVHNLHGWASCASDVDETGKLVIARFFPGSTDHSAFETNTFIKEDLLAYDKLLFDMIYWPTYLPTSTLLSPFDKAAPFQLSHPEINFPVYSILGWTKVVNGLDRTVDETGIVLTLLHNMSIRCCIPIPQIPTFSFLEPITLFEQDDEALFAAWACQANHLIHDLLINIMDLKTELFENWIEFECHAQSIPDWKRDTESPGLDNLLETEHLYFFCPQNSAGNIYWSRDEQGHHVIEDSLIQATFGITVDWHWLNKVYSILPQLYQILQTIHEGCGFHPYGTQIAEYLGLPLAVINNEYSGLEEYVEDPEYTSESESEDSDYVSASEDA